MMSMAPTLASRRRTTRVLVLLAAGALLLPGTTQTGQRGRHVPRPAPSGSTAGVSHTYRGTSKLQDAIVTVSPGKAVRVPVVVGTDAQGVSFSAEWRHADVSVRILDPGGNPVTGIKYRTLYTHDDTAFVYVPGARPGTWIVELTAGQVPTPGITARVTATEIIRLKSLPIAKITIRRLGARTFEFSSAGSTGSGGGPVAEYLWDLADGPAIYGRTVTHTYSGPGSFTVGLVVTGTDGQMGFAISPPITVPG